MSGMCGGASEVRQADAAIVEIVNGLKDEISEKCEDSSPVTPISYRSQVVAGTNYFIKAKLGSDQFVHLRVYQPLPHTGKPVTLSAFQKGKAENDPLEYF